MRIHRKCIVQTQRSHDDKAEAIGEGPWLIVVLQEEAARLRKGLGIHPMDPAGRGGKDRFEEGLGQVSVAASAQERRRFIEDVVGGKESAACVGSPREQVAGPLMHRIGLDQEGVETAGVYERLSSRRRFGRFLH